AFGAEPGGRQQLLGTLLRARDDERGLGACPFERLLDLGPCSVRQLGCLVPRLLEQASRARLGLPQLLARLALGVREDPAGFGLRRVQDLCALAVALLPVALVSRYSRLALVSADP